MNHDYLVDVYLYHAIKYSTKAGIDMITIIISFACFIVGLLLGVMSILFLLKKKSDIPQKLEIYEKVYSNYKMMTKFARIKGRDVKFSDILRYNNILSVGIYGYGELGKLTVEMLSTEGFHVEYIADYSPALNVNNVISPDRIIDRETVDAIIVTPVSSFESIKRDLTSKFGISSNIRIISLWELVESTYAKIENDIDIKFLD